MTTTSFRGATPVERADRRTVAGGRPPAKGLLEEVVDYDGVRTWRVPGQGRWPVPLFTFFHGTNAFYAPNEAPARVSLPAARRSIRRKGWTIR